MLRLPREVNPIFKDWLAAHYPLKFEQVMSRICAIRGGAENDRTFGGRMKGHGIFADLIRQSFARACREFGLNESRHALDTTRFVPPCAVSLQMELF